MGEISKEYEQKALKPSALDDIGRIYLGLDSSEEKRKGYWIGRMVQRDYEDAEIEVREIVLNQAAEVIIDLCNQFGKQDYPNKSKKFDFYSGGMSALEEAFSWLIRQGYATGDTLTIKLTNRERKYK